MTDDEKWLSATDGENGLWLCHNHHKLFDENIISISSSGNIIYDTVLNDVYKSFIKKITTKDIVPQSAFTERFAKYLDLRARCEPK